MLSVPVRLGDVTITIIRPDPDEGTGESLPAGHDPCLSASGMLAPPPGIGLELGAEVRKPSY